MTQKILTIVLPLLLPCLVYFGYVYFARQRAAARGEEVDGSWHDAPWSIILTVSAALMIAALIYARLHSGVEPGTKMEPPRFIDGEMQPSRVAE